MGTSEIETEAARLYDECMSRRIASRQTGRQPPYWKTVRWTGERRGVLGSSRRAAARGKAAWGPNQSTYDDLGV